jgi:hypothetical protein
MLLGSRIGKPGNQGQELDLSGAEIRVTVSLK